MVVAAFALFGRRCAKGEKDFLTAERHLRPLALREKSAAVLNALAWHAVLQDAVGRQALDDSLAANKQRAFESGPCLHTLAAIYAELGRTNDAMEGLRSSVAARGGHLCDCDLYVLGRIAEQYELADVAAALYRRVSRQSAAQDVYGLAERRLKKLGAAIPPPSPPVRSSPVPLSGS